MDQELARDRHCEYTHQAAALSCLKLLLRHIRYPSPSIDVYLLEDRTVLPNLVPIRFETTKL